MTNQLKDDLLHLKGRLETIEDQLSGQVKEIEGREQKWKSMDDRADKIYNTQGEIIRINVGGKKFATSANTLMATTNTLFHKLLESGRIDPKEEIFFDRSPRMFPHILDYLRTKQINYKKFNKEEMGWLKDDAEYYQIGDILEYLEERLKDIEYVSFDYSGPYTYNGQIAGNGKVQDLKDKSCMKGICATSPGWITIELNSEWEFDTMEVGGWKGNSTLWYADNGAGASIMTSTDKINWKSVGTIPYGFGNNIATVKLTKSSAKWVKFNYTSYLGLGYVFIKKIEDPNFK
jgi:hypothetical protein